MKNPSHPNLKESIVEQKFAKGESEEKVSVWAGEYDKPKERQMKGLYRYVN